MLHVWVISCTKEYFFRTSLLDFPNPWHKKILVTHISSWPSSYHKNCTANSIYQILCNYASTFPCTQTAKKSLHSALTFFLRNLKIALLYSTHFMRTLYILFCIHRLQTFRMSSVGIPTTVTTASLNRRKSMTSNKTMTSLASTNTNGHSSTCAGGQTLTTPLLQQKPPTKLEHNTQEIV